jgi:hypothetical protein
MQPDWSSWRIISISVSLADTTASEYVTAHRAANTTFLSIDPSHNYSQPHTYLQRVLAGLKSSPNMSALILHYRNLQDVTTTTINTIYADIIAVTPDTNHIASSTRHARNQPRARQPQHPHTGRNNYGCERGLPGIEYACIICMQDNHTTAKCSKNKNQAHIAHQVQVQVAAALAPFVTAYPSVNPSAVDEYTAAPSRILLDSAASTTMAPDIRYHHSTTRSSTMVNVANSNTTPATASGPATLPTTPQSTTLDVLVVPGMQDTLLAASQVTKSSDILIQKDKVFIIPHGQQPSPDRIRARGHLRYGVYEIVTAAADTVRHWTTSARANIAKLPSCRSSATPNQTIPRHYCQLENHSPTRASRLYQLSSRKTDTRTVSSSQTLNVTST